MSHFKLTSKIPITPFYYYDMELLDNTLDQALLSANKHGYTIHYALKANVEDRILDCISTKGFGADCVSGWEVQKALVRGFSNEKIVFAGVGKSDAEIKYALESDIFAFNCESIEEIVVINSLAEQQGKVANIALRINPDIKSNTHKHIATGHAASKFGIAHNDITQEVVSQLNMLKSINITGLHFHIGSQILELDFFEVLAQRTAELSLLFESYGLNIEHLNMGGGLGVDYDNPDSNSIVDFDAYFSCFAKYLPRDKTIHFELGRSLVAQCGDLVTKVLFTKQVLGNHNYIIVDAGMTELIRPALYGASHKIENISTEGNSRARATSYIGGPICESSDVFAEAISFPSTERGDILVIRSTGAYGSVMRSEYNLRPKAESYFSTDMWRNE